jgi:cation diffusion facilitator CzcD-associated flavoprotein CzcO
MYESAHFISSRKTSGFFDFPMPATYPDYPGNRLILQYIRDFAETYGLRDAIRFGCEIRAVQRVGDGWQVTLSDDSTRRYRAVVCATGMTWTPRTPQHPGRFSGEIMHSSSYYSPETFRGKRVLVVGLGNSGADIACDAATHADASFVSIRRGYHILPKHLFGVPIDEFEARGPQLPLRVERPLFTALLRLLHGDRRRYGLPKPDHKLFEAHPLLNSQLLHHLQHGDVAVRPDVARLEGNRVRFVDGSTETIDLVVYATGYDWAIPYAETYFDWCEGYANLYLTAFKRKHPNLFGIGYMAVNSSVWPCSITSAIWLGNTSTTKSTHPNVPAASSG